MFQQTGGPLGTQRTKTKYVAPTITAPIASQHRRMTPALGTSYNRPINTKISRITITTPRPPPP